MPELSQAGKRRKASARERLKKGRLRRNTAGKSPIGLDEAKLLLLPLLGSARRALLAVSGGPDSVALMRLSTLVAKAERMAALEVATVDHGLRENSRAEAEEVGAWARDCGLAHAVLSWEGRKPSTRIQERARAARYTLLHARMRESGATILITAHTLDDQAETVLMRIAHGSGIAGLAGMRPLSEQNGLIHARPFLSVPKGRLVATCHANGWPFVEDPSNENSRFARARWRKLAPVLEKEGLSAARLAKLAERAASFEEALESKTEAAFAAVCIEERADGLVLDMERMVRREPREVALRLLLRAVTVSGGGERSAPIRLERAENLLKVLCEAFSTRKPLKRTLGGALLAYDGAERLFLRREAARRRGGKREGGDSKPALPARVRDASPANQSNSIALSALV
ncbi:MAG: tRNA lysidine(34) synthetase TilS [Beijerinckiaceae bacterium]